MPATAPRTVWRGETAAPTTSHSAKVFLYTGRRRLWVKAGGNSVLLFLSEVRLHGCKKSVRRSGALNALQGESDPEGVTINVAEGR